MEISRIKGGGVSLFSKCYGAAQGLLHGFKNGGNIDKAIKETGHILSLILNPLRDSNNGKLPNLIFIDAYLIGFLFKYSALYLMFNGVKEQFLLDKAVIKTVSVCLDIQPDSFISILKNMDSGELKQFAGGSELANKTYEGFLKNDKECFLKICNHICQVYKIVHCADA